MPCCILSMDDWAWNRMVNVRNYLVKCIDKSVQIGEQNGLLFGGRVHSKNKQD